MKTDTLYPFTAIVGQDSIKKALLLNLIDPKIGGLLICGEKGTAKSTIVRSLGALSEKKVMTLPLNATEDMLVGGIDFVKTIGSSENQLMEGLFYRVNGHILYVDEINLLSDSLAQTIVVTASSGVNIIEREGISYSHPSSFILIGTMNPEEGGLRPQLLDKFGLYVSVTGEDDIQQRTEIIRRRMEYEKNPKAFVKSYEQEQQKCKDLLDKAYACHKKIVVDDSMRKIAAQFAQRAFTQGNRTELLLIQTAAAMAALDLRTHITIEDLKEACIFVLPHRQQQEEEQQQNPQQDHPEDQDQENDQDSSDQNSDNSDNEDSPDTPDNPDTPEEDESEHPPDNQDYEEDQKEPFGDEDQVDVEYSEDHIQDPQQSVEEELVYGQELYETVELPTGFKDHQKRKGTGHRKKTFSSVNKGRYAGFTMTKSKANQDVALDATLRAAAIYQKQRPKGQTAIAIEKSDIRYKKREKKMGMTVVFVVDASGSMGAKKRMVETKEAILSMLMDSYQKRDKVGMIAFRKQEAEVLLPITSSVDLAQKALQELPTGGRTPLASGLYTAWQLIQSRKIKDPDMMPLVILVTDGRANHPLWADPVEDAYKCGKLFAENHIPSIVVDTENDFLTFELAKKIAWEMEADYFKVSEIRSQKLRNIVSIYQKES